MSRTKLLHDLGEYVAALETENKDLRVALRHAQDEITHSIRECKVCGCTLPTGPVLDAIEAEGVDVRSQLGSETLMRWSVGYCGISCQRDMETGLRVVNGGAQ